MNVCLVNIYILYVIHSFGSPCFPLSAGQYVTIMVPLLMGSQASEGARC